MHTEVILTLVLWYKWQVLYSFISGQNWDSHQFRLGVKYKEMYFKYKIIQILFIHSNTITNTNSLYFKYKIIQIRVLYMCISNTTSNTFPHAHIIMPDSLFYDYYDKSLHLTNIRVSNIVSVKRHLSGWKTLPAMLNISSCTCKNHF